MKYIYKIHDVDDIEFHINRRVPNNKSTVAMLEVYIGFMYRFDTKEKEQDHPSLFNIRFFNNEEDD